MKKFFVMICFTCIFLWTVAGGLAAEEKVKIGYLRLVMSLPTFVSEEKGLFAQHGLKIDMVPFQSGTAIIDALVTGRIDANCGSAISGHWFAEQNVAGRFKIFLVYGPKTIVDHTFVVVVKKDSPIKDLKGSSNTGPSTIIPPRGLGRSRTINGLLYFSAATLKVK